MPAVVRADGPILQRIVASTPSISFHGLSRQAFIKFDAAQAKTTWGLCHRRRFALVEGDDVLASAERYDLPGMLDQRPVTICGIAAVFNHAPDAANNYAGVLVERLLEDATRDGSDLALLFRPANTVSPVPDGFEVVPTMDVELTVAESSRRGAPMTLVRGGEDRDLGAIAAMGEVRASQFRFHIDRKPDFVKHAAYLVMSVVDGTWTIEECGDRDSSGARVGALLQALIAREPVESRPVIRGWLPAGFVPPQVTIASASPSAEALVARRLSARVPGLHLTNADLLYWRNDVF